MRDRLAVGSAMAIYSIPHLVDRWRVYGGMPEYD